MITYGDTVVCKGIYHFHFEFSAEFTVIGTALIEVSGVKQEHIIFATGISHAIHYRAPFYDTRFTIPFGLADRLQMGMRIVKVQNDQLRRARCQARRTKCHGYIL